MPPEVLSSPSVPEGLIELLAGHLPYSLPLLRRLQFTRFKGGLSSTSRIILTPPDALRQDEKKETVHFTAAYLDPATSPETQMWVYSTLEDGELSDSDREVCAEQIVAVAEEARKIGNAYEGDMAYPGALLVGTLHSAIQKVMKERGVKFRSNSADLGSNKWLFRTEDLPNKELNLEDGLHWSPATPEDCRVAISRTYLPRQMHTFVLLPSLMIKSRDKTPIAWAFLGVDGSLSSLYCEEAYRGRGFAKALAAKLFRADTEKYGDDGWCAADVAPDNTNSQALCKSLGGTLSWFMDWILLEL